MRAYIATTPFIVLLASTIALLVVGSDATGTSVLLGRVFIGASVLCLLCVPAVSRKSLVLGYMALLLPFVAFAVLTISTEPNVTVTVTEKNEFTWDKDPKVVIDEFVKAIEAQKKKPNKQLEPTPIVVTPAADAAGAPTTGAAHH